MLRILLADVRNYILCYLCSDNDSLSVFSDAGLFLVKIFNLVAHNLLKFSLARICSSIRSSYLCLAGESFVTNYSKKLAGWRPSALAIIFHLNFLALLFVKSIIFE